MAHQRAPGDGRHRKGRMRKGTKPNPAGHKAREKARKLEEAVKAKEESNADQD